MTEEFYKIPDNPQYRVDDIRKLQNSDPVNADTIVNPLILRILENIAAVHRQSTNIVVSATPPTSGPALWFCTDKDWRPDKETIIATALLGDPSGAADADVTSEVNNTVYPVLNATVSMEGGNLVATIEES